MAAFILIHLEVWAYADEPGGAPDLAHNYGGTEHFTLKPVEMFIPPVFRRRAAFAFLGKRCGQWSVWRRIFPTASLTAAYTPPERA